MEKDREYIIIKEEDARKQLASFLNEQKKAYKEKRSNVRMAGSHYKTMNWIIYLYCKQVNKVDNLPFMESLPGFTTITTSLATHEKCTNRTIFNHLDRLMELGLIINKEVSGRGLKLWISPEIIFKGQPRKTLKYADFAQKEENFSDIILNNLELKDIDNRYTGDCGKNDSPFPLTEEGVAAQRELDNKLCENTKVGKEHPTSKCVLGEPAKKQAENNPENKKNDPTPAPKNPAERDEMNVFVADFIEFALKMLYPGLKLLSSEYSQLFMVIKHTVFNNFRDKPINKPGKNGEVWDKYDWHNYYADNLVKRIMFAQSYFNQNYHLSIPPPITYFSTASKMNFHQTQRFHEKYEHGKKLTAIKREVALSKRGKGRFPNRSMLDLYTTHQRRVAMWNDQVLMDKFNVMAKKLYI